MTPITHLQVRCPVTITSSAPPPGFPLPANLPCGALCSITTPAALMQVRCPRGHQFIATPQDLEERDAS